MSVEDILSYAFEKFDENDYDNAVKAFMAAYHASNDDKQKADIYGVIKENFILPNEDEFKTNYYENVELLRSSNTLMLDEIPDYNGLSCKMIPVSDDRFYVWDGEIKNFWGGEAFDISYIKNTSTKEFDSIIIDGFSDMRLILPEITNKLYANVYIVITHQEMMKKFFSFFAMPGIAGLFLKNVYLFDDREKIKTYLYETGKYIPRTIKSFSDYDYSEMMSEIHEKRIHEKKKNKPYVSIAIPTFNRGEIALKNVKRLQLLMYDEEVEFLICNNSSTKDLEQYDQISILAQNDSRINYMVMPSEVFRDSFENVMRMPNGKYAIFCSDEDYIILENFMIALNEIYNHEDAGVRCFGAIGVDGIAYYLTDSSRGETSGIDGLKAGLGCNYITGLCVNADKVKEDKLVDHLNGLYKENNNYYYMYPHCVYMGYLAYQSGLYLANVPLFYDSAKEKQNSSNKTDESNIIGDSIEKMPHIRVESRIQQARDQMQVILDMGLSEIDTAEGIYYSFYRIFDLLTVAYYVYPGGMKKEHLWVEACEIINDFAQEKLQELENNYSWDPMIMSILRDVYQKLYKRQIELDI